jgi:sedoheptulokinase
MSKLILGLDMGTTSISAVALNESGRVLHAVTKTHHASAEGLPADYAEQNPERIRVTAFETLKSLSELCRGAEFRAIALTGQMHSTVILDQGGNVSGNVITWQDRRSVAEGAQKSLLAELQQRATDQAMLNTGCRLSLGYLGTTLFAMRRLKQLPSNIASVSFVADWIGSCLTGNASVTERSHAASSGLFDLVADDWSDSLLQAAEIPREWLPQVADSGAIVGTLNAAASAETGLPTGLPVINAVGDNQASVLSALPDLEGSVLINIGTGGQIVWRIPQFTRQLPLDTRILPGNPDPTTGKSKPQFMIVGAGLCGGDAIAWVNRTIRRWLADFGSLVSEEAIWDRLQQLVAQETPAPELVCEPFFRGTRYEPDRRGLLKGISVDNLSPAHLLASVLTGIAQSMSDVWLTSPQSKASLLQRIAMAGNAVKHNPLLVDAVRRHFGVSVEVARHSEEAATGAAMLAGVHLKTWRTIEEARQAVQTSAQA